MKKENNKQKNKFFENLATKATMATGSTAAILLAFAPYYYGQY